MSGTTEGGKKAALKVKSLYGDDFYKKIGTIGGQKKVKKGFGTEEGIERARRVGAIGGRISRRGKQVKENV